MQSDPSRVLHSVLLFGGTPCNLASAPPSGAADGRAEVNREEQNCWHESRRQVSPRPALPAPKRHPQTGCSVTTEWATPKLQTDSLGFQVIALVYPTSPWHSHPRTTLHSPPTRDPALTPTILHSHPQPCTHHPPTTLHSHPLTTLHSPPT